MPGGEHHGLRARLVERFGGRVGEAIYAFFACGLALAISGLAAYLAKQPLLFPSLGPTALLFFERPMAATSSPRNALIGHAVAILAGFLSLGLFGLLDNPSILVEDATPARIGAGAFSVALTGAVLLLLSASHPPTGATTLIVSLGFLQTPSEMAALMAGVVVLTAVGWPINRAAGVPVPAWGVKQ
ncbi:HPP family protein [Rubrobacter tropicus]|uniref:HPP family protein n=1 Tax=Rubrobacter tropicus TaxID=2653851 RepID=UPI001D1989F0|nr:HPP family protein [Rubrobacter tropicus]